MAFLISVALIKASPWALYKTKLDIDGDFLKYDENSSFFDS